MLRSLCARVCLLPLLAVLFLAPGLCAASQEGPNLGAEIRAGIRWLRSNQNLEEGSYGGSVGGTAWALRAFAECPDHYRAGDGPFVRKALDYLRSHQTADGTIADSSAKGDARLAQTRLAAAALALYADNSTSDALKSALKKLASDGLEGPGWEPPASLESAEAAQKRAVELIALRDKDGMWNGKEGSVIESSRSLIELSYCDRAIKKATKKSAPAQIARLPESAPVDAARVNKALVDGGKFLASLAPDGRFGKPGQPDAGISAVALGALGCVPEPRPPEVQKALDAGLAWLISLQHADGSIHDGKLANYGTSAAILALTRAKKSEYAPVIAKARGFLQALQADEGEGFSEGDIYYGGMGYGGDSEKADLSNLQMALEALSASGLKSGDPTYAKALNFLQRCQNRSETNDIRIAEDRAGKVVILSGNDGGAGYAPGDSKAGFELVDGTKVPRSYGSMTYALLKSFVFAGLDKQDPRVQAAWKWCREHYTLDINPGFVASEDPAAAYQGLFYYFHTMARALDVLGEDVLVDGAGKPHAWRNELCGRLVAMQDKTDGSWLNRNSPRWYEGNPVVATAYALLTLDAARPR